MNLRTIGKMAMAGALVLGLTAAGTASAATRNINIYGASAQYLYWKTFGTSFLTSAGCSGITSGEYQNTTTPGDSNNGKFAYTKGLACTNYAGDDVIIRVASKSSYDGIWAVQPIDPAANCGSADQRKQIDETTLNFGGQLGSYNLTCQHVVVGASDVSAKAFKQTSTGYKLGPLMGSAANFQENINLFPGSPPNDAGLDLDTPLIIPFGFFLNKAVVSGTCSNSGEACPVTTDAGYPGAGTAVHGDLTYCGGANTCNVGRVQNLSRQQIALLFGGNVTNWNQLGSEFPNLPLWTCIRHAGSGTVATLDKAIMFDIGFGTQLPVTQRTGTLGGKYIWFNDGSPDELKCVDGRTAAGAVTAGFYNQAPWNGNSSGSFVGGIGFADADQATKVATDAGGDNTYPNVYGPVKFNGYMPYRWNVRNGAYDNFWTLEHMYRNPGEPPLIKAVVSDMVTFITPATIPASEAIYYGTPAEMRVTKGTTITFAEDKYPITSTPTTPQSP